MAMPAVPRTGFVVIQTEFVLRGLEAVFNRPAVSLDQDQFLDACPSRTPGRKEGQVSIGNFAPDQQAACPKASSCLIVFGCIQISQFVINPVIQPGGALGAFTCR